MYWRRLPRSKVVVVDETLLSSFQTSLSSIPVFLLPVRGEWLSAHPRTLARWFVEFVRCGRPRKSYWRAVFAELQPTICLTGSDHNPWILGLADDFPEINWIVLQNAFRFPDPAPQSALGRNVNYAVEFWSFGQWELDCYELENIHFKNSRPAGSIRNSVWLQIASHRQTRKDFDVCLLSQFRTSLIGGYVMQEFEACVHALRAWMDSHPEKKVAVAGVAVDHAEILREKEFFATIVPKAELFSGRRHDEWQTYDLADRSEVSVTSNSTAGIESLARGNRALLTGSVIGVATPSLTEKFWSEARGGDEGFAAALDKLLTMTDEDFWSALDAAEVNYIMAGAPHSPTARDLMERVSALLE